MWFLIIETNVEFGFVGYCDFSCAPLTEYEYA